MKKIGKIFILMAFLALLTVGIVELAKRKTFGNFLNDVKNNVSQKITKDPRAIAVDEKTVSSIAGGQAVQNNKLPDIKDVETVDQVFNFPFSGENFSIRLSLAEKYYHIYNASEKYYRYFGKQPDNWRDDYYGMFLAQKVGDTAITSLVKQLRIIASRKGYNENQLVELAMNFVQSIPYDKIKADNIASAAPNYPYETLYKQLGICTDKSFLAVLILRELGYGAAILDYPNVDHASAAIACSGGYDFRKTGYCYIETTNFLPISVVPQKFNDKGVITGVSLTSYKGQFDNIFSDKNLGLFEIYQKTTGKVYTGVATIHAKVSKIQALEKSISEAEPILNQMKIDLEKQKAALDNLRLEQDSRRASGDIDGYSQNLNNFNYQVGLYRAASENIKYKFKSYNDNVSLYNEMIRDFYSVK